MKACSMFILSLAEVSKNLIPFSSATFLPRSSDISRLSSISHLLPECFIKIWKKTIAGFWITCGHAFAKTLHKYPENLPMSILSTSSEACSLIFLNHFEILSKLLEVLLFGKIFCRKEWKNYSLSKKKGGKIWCKF